jgi:NAD+--dinitrogen-reductase ADP-D-ribosyltransferase
VGDRADRYEAARMRGAMSGIGMLLDLLYTFCQEELRRDHQDQEVIELFRGTHDAECYLVKEADGREELVEFNSVSSFTSDRERAWEFGSAVWRVTVPLSKIVFFSGLLPNGLLSGESEYIVLGGDYRVRRLAW